MKPLDLTQPITAKVATRLPIKKAWLDEVTELIPNLTIEVVETTKQMAVWYNAPQKSNYGVFASVKQIVDTDSHNIRAFYMPFEDFTKLGITNHLALYDNTDRDNVLDFYVGLKPRLDARAKANGFKSNFAWEFIHEILHGLEQNEGQEYLAGDRTHDKETEGKLKELLIEHLKTLPALKKSFLQLMMEYSGLLQVKQKTVFVPTDTLSLVKRQGDKVLAEMESLGYDMRITEGYRSVARQNELYSQGRPKGTIVTNAKGGESLHNYGVALDYVFRKEGYDVHDLVWKLFGKVGEKHGFEWGGNWASFQDKPHLEMKLGYSLKDFQQGKVDYSKFN